MLAIFVRSVFRVVEWSGGFNDPLFNQQITFMLLEGGMMSIVAIALVVCHPGIAFKGRWGEAMWKLRQGGVRDEKLIEK